MSKTIQEMFGAISKRYDSLNTLLSMGRDRSWRRWAARRQRPKSDEVILDLCGGTGEFLFASITASQTLQMGIIADFSFEMLTESRKKILIRAYSHLYVVQMDALKPPFKPKSFDRILCGFGMRNLDSLQTGIREVALLLKPGGIFTTLEFFKPTQFIPRILNQFIAPCVFPMLGGLLSGKPDAYRYLFESVRNFCSLKEYAEELRNLGFSAVKVKSCDGGIAHIVHAERNS